MIKGIHHITAISSSARKTVEFYSEILGLRMVKKTVNFDAPDVYHLYFGNEAGDPGTIITFFPFEQAGTGMRGTGQATKIQYAVPQESLSFWIDRFQKYHVKHEKIEKKFGKSTLKFYDFDGLQLELVMHDESDIEKGWSELIEEQYAITSFFGVELSVRDKKETEKVLFDIFDYEEVEQDDHITRYQSKHASYATYVDIFEMPGWPEGRQSAGTVHHVAFRTENDETQNSVREQVEKAGLSPTPMIDRNYFHSVYFREPSGILFEIATDDIGFTIDESLESLGQSLKLPAQYEAQRKHIESILPNIDQETSDLPFEYKYIEPEGKAKKHFLLLHGTGGNETTLIPFAQDLEPDFGIIALRGNILEGHTRRFFKRKNMKAYGLESIHKETENLHTFLVEFSHTHNIELEDVVLMGFSNGANLGLSHMFTYPGIIQSAILLHPMIPFEPNEPIDLKGVNVFMSSGKDDPFVRSEDEPQKLEQILKDASAQVMHFTHDEGHSLTDQEVAAVVEFLK